MLRSLAKYDGFSGASDNAVTRSALGTFMTGCSLFLMAWLSVSQFSAYRAIVPAERMTLDPAFGSDTLPVRLNLSMYRIKCADVNIDIDSQTGKHKIHVSDGMTKTPFVDAQERAKDPGKYATPKALATFAPGCNVAGTFSVSKVAGNFHIALGKNLGAQKGHATETRDSPRYQFGLAEMTHYNTSHVIHHLSFGDGFDTTVRPSPGSFYERHPTHSSARAPLDGAVRMLGEDVSTAQFQYFIKVVPTVFTRLDGKSTGSNSFSATEHVQEVRFGPRGLVSGRFPHPGVFFKYDFSPIMVNYFEERRSFWQFLTSFCAIIGGLFTCMGLCTKCLYASGDAIGKLD
jgi:hypothetical protein